MRGSIVVIGASAGGSDAICGVLAKLPPDFDAPIAVALHLSAPGDADIIAGRMAAAGPLPVHVASDSEPIRPRQIYLAPSDRHLMVDRQRLMVTRGARENRNR